MQEIIRAWPFTIRHTLHATRFFRKWMTEGPGIGGLTATNTAMRKNILCCFTFRRRWPGN